MRRIHIPTLLIALLYQSLAETADAELSSHDRQYRLRGSNSANTSGLPWATQRIVEKSLEALASGNGISVRNFTYQLQNSWPAWNARIPVVEDTSVLGISKAGLTSKWGDVLLTSISGALQTAFTNETSLSSVIENPAGEGTKDGLSHPLWQPSQVSREISHQYGDPTPGVVIAVYEDFFSRASEVAVKLLRDNFKKVQLKTATATAHIPVLGDFDIKLKNVKLSNLQLDKASTGISLGDDGTFVFVVQGLAATVDGHFQWRRTKFPFISGGCQTRVIAEDGNIQLRVSVVDDGSGRPAVGDIQAPELTFSDLSISTSEAKLAWLYNAIAQLAHTQIQAAIIREVSKQVETKVPDQVNKVLQGVPTTVDVKGLQLNTSLVKTPEVTPSRLVVKDWGRFKNPAGVSEDCPFVERAGLKKTPAMPGGSPYMLIANLDESIVNCLTWDLFRQGKLTRFFVGDEVPKKALYTDTWRFVIPEVYIRCPGCPMALNATVTAAPDTIMDPATGIVSRGIAELSFFMAEKQDSGVPWTPLQRRVKAEGNTGEAKAVLGEHLFTLSLSGELTVRELALEKDLPDRPEGWKLNLSMKVNQGALAVDVVESDVGPINKAALHLALTVAAFLVEDEVNHGILKDGFPLPDIPHIKVERANVTVADSALALGTDVSYAE